MLRAGGNRWALAAPLLLGSAVILWALLESGRRGSRRRGVLRSPGAAAGTLQSVETASHWERYDDAVDSVDSVSEKEAAREALVRMHTSADSYCRERALFEFVDLVGREAIPCLRGAALDSRQPINVRSAAQAHLDRFRRLSAESPKGFLDVDRVESVEVGAPFVLRIRYGSVLAIPDAKVRIVLPPGVEAESPTGLFWAGALEPNVSRELAATLRIPRGPIEGTATILLSVDFGNGLDLDIIRRSIRIVCGERSGAIRVE